MKIISLFFCLLISLSVQSQKLTIYTYDSFVSEWGPGPIIKEKFEKNYNTELEFVAVDSAATLLNKIILEGSTTKADIILGLDMNLLDAANKSNLFSKHNIEDINDQIQLPIKWDTENFVPYNYGYFAFVYNNKNLKIEFSAANDREVEFYSSMIFSIEVKIKSKFKNFISGGRYDQLTTNLGFRKVSAVGAAVNMNLYD